MSAFILSAMASALLCIVVMPKVKDIVGRASVGAEDDGQRLGLGLSTLLIVGALFIFSLIFTPLLEAAWSVFFKGDPGPFWLELFIALRTPTLLGSVFGVLAFYWIYLLMHPDELRTPSLRRSHTLWGYVLAVILLVGALQPVLPRMLERLQVLPTPWGSMEFAEVVPTGTSESIKADLDVEAAAVNRSRWFLGRLQDLSSAIDRDRCLISVLSHYEYLVAELTPHMERLGGIPAGRTCDDIEVPDARHTQITSNLQTEQLALGLVIKPIASCVLAAKTHFHGDFLTIQPMEVFGAKFRRIMTDATRPAHLMRLHEEASKLHETIHPYLTDREAKDQLAKDQESCLSNEEIKEIEGKLEVIKHFDVQDSFYFHLALGLVLAYTDNLSGSISILVSDKLERAESLHLAQGDKISPLVFSIRRRSYLNPVHNWYNQAPPSYLIDSLNRQHLDAFRLYQRLRKITETLGVDTESECYERTLPNYERVIFLQLLQAKNNLAYNMAALDWPHASETRASQLIKTVININLEDNFQCRKTLGGEPLYALSNVKFLEAAYLDTAAFVEFMYAVRNQINGSLNIEESRRRVELSHRIFEQALSTFDSGRQLLPTPKDQLNEYLSQHEDPGGLESTREIILAHAKRASDYLRSN